MDLANGEGTESWRRADSQAGGVIDLDNPKGWAGERWEVFRLILWTLTRVTEAKKILTVFSRLLIIVRR